MEGREADLDTQTVDPACGRSCDIVLRICNKEMARLLVRKGSVLGFAQPAGEGEVRRVATVFYSRVEEVTAATNSLTGEVLGTALAHELGHLLLGKGAHSRGGLMRCPWDTEELLALHRGQLLFDSAQSSSIVESIEARGSRALSALHQVGGGR